MDFHGERLLLSSFPRLTLPNMLIGVDDPCLHLLVLDQVWLQITTTCRIDHHLHIKHIRGPKQCFAAFMPCIIGIYLLMLSVHYCFVLEKLLKFNNSSIISTSCIQLNLVDSVCNNIY